jgi:hypothetical protein
VEATSDLGTVILVKLPRICPKSSVEGVASAIV